MGKMYQGKKPNQSEGWNQIGRFIDLSDIEWFVYEKNQKHSEEWFTYKIVANGKAISKANYWVARNAKTKQLGFARDVATMKEHRPELFFYFGKIMNDKQPFNNITEQHCV